MDIDDAEADVFGDFPPNLELPAVERVKEVGSSVISLVYGQEIATGFDQRFVRLAD